jgi:GntR family transcriptional regulator/MocR family aminotransferase
VYVTPSHQFPLGTVMALSTRAALLSWARRRDAVIIEDDYDSEFRFQDRPLAPLQHLDRDGRVVYVGTFSKTLLPSIRLGFVVAPASLTSALRTAKFLADSHTDPIAQQALASFIDDGDFARHVRRARRSYAQRHALIAEAVASSLSPWLSVLPAAAGLHVCAQVRADTAAMNIEEAARHARRAGVFVETLARYCAGDIASRPGLLLGYGRIPAADIPRGLELLRACLAASAVRGAG